MSQISKFREQTLENKLVCIFPMNYLNQNTTYDINNRKESQIKQ